MAKENKRIRVVVVDDSPTARELLVGILHENNGIQVVGTGVNGEDALRLVERLKPDVITMDVRMPVMDGLEATRQIMRKLPTPIVIISGSMQHQDMDLTFKALRAGALAALSKPGLDDPSTCEKVAQTVRLMADVQVVHHWHKPSVNDPKPEFVPAASENLLPYKVLPGGQKTDISLVAIASSTGGPSALATVIGKLPANYPLPILIVQHVSPGFAAGLAEWLATQTALRVEVAAHGDAIRPGFVFLAPDDYHMKVTENGLIELVKAPPYKGLRPSANFMFESVARYYGPRSAGLILTGMGDDGSDGLEFMYKAGALTVAQDAKSCVVYGMPREAIIRNLIDRVMDLEQMSSLLIEIGKYRSSNFGGIPVTNPRGV
jgi:two-component system chemotaxis response regulator CheB